MLLSRLMVVVVLGCLGASVDDLALLSVPQLAVPLWELLRARAIAVIFSEVQQRISHRDNVNTLMSHELLLALSSESKTSILSLWG